MRNWLKYIIGFSFNKAQLFGSNNGKGQVESDGPEDLIKAYIHHISSEAWWKPLSAHHFYEIVALKESILFSQEACQFLNIVGSHVKGNRLSFLVCEPQI